MASWIQIGRCRKCLPQIANPAVKPLDEKQTVAIGWECCRLIRRWQPLSLLSPGVFLLALFFSSTIHSFLGKIRFMARREEKLLLDSALVYLALLLPAWSRWGGWMTLARMWITVVTDTVVVSWPAVELGGWETSGSGEGWQWNKTQSNLLESPVGVAALLFFFFSSVYCFVCLSVFCAFFLGFLLAES